MLSKASWQRSERSLGLEEVLAGFDLEDIDAAFDQADGLLARPVDELVPGDVAEAGQLRAGTHGAEGVARMLGVLNSSRTRRCLGSEAV